MTRPAAGETWLMKDGTAVYVYKVREDEDDDPSQARIEYAPWDDIESIQMMTVGEWAEKTQERIEA